MKFKDVAHLYLGCELWSPGAKIIVGTLSGIVAHAAHFKINGVNYSAHIDNYRPILRPLSSMTEDEAISVCRLRWDSTFMQVHREMGDGISECFEFTYQAYDASMYEDAQECCNLDFKCRTNQKEENFRMTIYPNFSVYIGWLRPTGNHNVTPLSGTTETVIYFLSKHFDLFGLIESGEAIDATKTP